MAAGGHLAIFPNSGSPPVTIAIFPTEIFRNKQKTLEIVHPPEKAEEEGEAPLQLLEGCEYEYRLSSPGFSLSVSNEVLGIISQSKIESERESGRIRPSLYVGTIDLVLNNIEGQEVSHLPIEVRSLKLDYRSDYRIMLELITDRCMSLILQLRSPASSKLIPDPGRTPETIGQQFAFLRSLVGSREFRDAITRITIMPHHRLERCAKHVPSASRYRTSNRVIKEFVKGTRRIDLPREHVLRASGVISTLPEFITVHRKQTTVDTPENRFVNFALNSFVAFVNSLRLRLLELGENPDSPLSKQIQSIQKNLESILFRPFFRELSYPHFLPLGSPVLQRKGGYRELYRAWLHFNAAARLCWHGGDDVFGAGKRDVAVLYEYWVFFRFLDILSDLFILKKPAIESLIQKTGDGFSLTLKAGQHLMLAGEYLETGRPLNVRFSYNRTFRRVGDETSNYPNSGSWTERMRPDYSLSVWPVDFTEDEAEVQELMVHLHFDAKYSIENVDQLFGIRDEELGPERIAEELAGEKAAERVGTYRRANLLKMHAYKDAIRRSEGAYVIYPGSRKRVWRGYHEILPGLGAFPLRPNSSGNDDGSAELRDFISEVIGHFSDRATRRENEGYRKYLIQSGAAPNKVLHVKIPEHLQDRKRLPPPQEIPLLVIWQKGEGIPDWVNKNGMVFLESASGKSVDPSVVGAAFILLLEEGSRSKGVLYATCTKNDNCVSGPLLVTAQTLKDTYHFPFEILAQFYLAFQVTKQKGYENTKWDIGPLLRARGLQDPVTPKSLTITLAELLCVGVQSSQAKNRP